MSSSVDVHVELHSIGEPKPIAHITLNGYNIEAGGALGFSGAMRSFKLISGDLEDAWSMQEILEIQDGTGVKQQGRIAALPVDDGGMGFIEFL